MEKKTKLVLWGSAIVLSLAIFSTGVKSDEIVFGFKSPSFSGAGQSSHYLTIENQEKSRRDKIEQGIERCFEHYTS